jgi:hypothetical protein
MKIARINENLDKQINEMMAIFYQTIHKFGYKIKICKLNNK